MIEERTVLQEDVFPRLRRLCARHGAKFQAIDLRWGISEEASLKHRAVKVCLSEITRCQRVTKRPNFLLLMGDRYGWQPLPNEIPSEEWETITARLDQDALSNLHAWYRCDENAVPPVYVLQPRTGEFTDQAVWDQIEHNLRQILLNTVAGLPFSDQQRMKYQASVTEQEIELGVFRYQHASQGAFCFFRDVVGLPDDAGRFKESDPILQRRLAQVKQRLLDQLPDNIDRYQALWTGDGLTFDAMAFGEMVYARLAAAVEAELAIYQEIGPLISEEEAHRAFLNDHTKHFIGRADLLERVDRYINSAATLPLLIYGKSSIGKSSAMAMVAQTVPDAFCRFIGITPQTTDIRSLLYQLCKHIQVRYHAETPLPDDYDGLVKALPTFLAHATSEAPLAIFLDALDQLVPTHTPTNLYWLPSVLPPHVKLVMSVTPSAYLDMFKRRFALDMLVEVGMMPVSHAHTLLDRLLGEAGRSLTQAQYTEVIGKFARTGSPLFLKLAFEEARQWHSYTEFSPLSEDIPSLISENLFTRLASAEEHGEMMVSRCLAYLAAARHGLAEDELLDILRQDKVFWTAFVARSHPSQRAALDTTLQLPIVVWSRLYFDLEPYLTERGLDANILFNFYHQQFEETVRQVYLVPHQQNYHAHLVRYFAEQSLYIDQIANVRKLSELAFQQVQAGFYEAYVATLTDYSFLEAGLEVRGVQPLIDDCALWEDEAVALIGAALNLSFTALSQMPQAMPSHLVGRLMLYAKHNPTIRRLLTQVQQMRPGLYPVNLDSPFPTHYPAGRALIREVQAHQQTVTGIAGVLELADGRFVSWGDDCSLRFYDAEGNYVNGMTEHLSGVTDVIALHNNNLVSWAGGTRSSDHRLLVWATDGTVRHKMNMHTKRVRGALELAGGDLASWSVDGMVLIWDSHGRIKHKLILDAAHLGALEYRPGHLLIWSNDHQLRLWEIATTNITPFIGHQGLIQGALVLDSKQIVSWSADGALHVWNADGQLHEVMRHGGKVLGCLRLASGDFLSWSADSSLRLWNEQESAAMAVLNGHESEVIGALELQPNRIVSWARDNTLRVWSLEPHLRAEATLIGHADRIRGVVALDFERFVSWSGDQSIRIWHIDQAEASILDKNVVGAMIAKDRRLVAWTTNDVSFWRTDTPSYRSDASTGDERHLRSGVVSKLLSLPNGTIISQNAATTLALWTADGQLITSFHAHDRAVFGLAALSNGRWLSWSSDHTIRLWNGDGTPSNTITVEGGWYPQVKVLRDDTFVSWITNYNSHNYDLVQWSTDGVEIRHFVGHIGAIQQVFELSDGRLISIEHGGNIILWNREGELVANVEGRYDYFAPIDDHRFLIKTTTAIDCWDIASNTVTNVLSGDEETAYAPDMIIPIAGERMLLVYKGAARLAVYTNEGAFIAALSNFEELDEHTLSAFASQHDVSPSELFAVFAFKSVELSARRVLVGYRGDQVIVMTADGERLATFYADRNISSLELVSVDPLTVVAGTAGAKVLFLVYHQPKQEKEYFMDAIIKDFILSANADEMQEKFPAVLQAILAENPNHDAGPAAIITETILPQARRLVEEETNHDQRAIMLSNIGGLEIMARMISQVNTGGVESVFGMMMIELIEQMPYLDESELQLLLNTLPAEMLPVIIHAAEGHLAKLDDDEMILRFEAAIAFFRRQL